MRRNRKAIALILALMLVIATFTSCAPKEAVGTSVEDFEPVVLRLASDAPIEHMATVLNNELIAEVSEKTEGRVTIQLYPASQLGGYDTVMEEVMQGTIDMCQTSFNAGVDQRFAAFNTPALSTGYEEAKIVYGPDAFMSQTYVDLCDEFGMVFGGFVLEGFIGLGLVKEAKDIKVPGAPKGVQIRVWGSPVCIDTMSDLGFKTVTVPYAEAPMAIQTGVVDGWVGGTPNVNYAWVGEIIDYFVVNYLYAEISAYMISKKTMDKLLPEDQAVLMEAISTSSKNSFIRAEENDEDYLKKLQDDYGVQVIRYSPEEIQAQADFVRNTTWPKLESVISKDVLDGLKAELDKL